MNDHCSTHPPESVSPEERRQAICLLIDKGGSVRVDELADRWDVRPITIRRDLDLLANEGLAIRVRGGALRNERVRLELGYDERMHQNHAAKVAIAQRAAELVRPGQTIILDTGTTTQLLARELASRTDIQVVTNSMVVAFELRGALGVSVILLGGQARKGGGELIGPLTERILGDFHADIAFLGADAVDVDGGFYTTDLGVARIEELMIQTATTAVVLADTSKLNRRAFVRYASYDTIDIWIAGGPLPANAKRALRAKPIEIIHVTTPASGI
ncbi:MAG: DeoR/GlpR transcriptional regulator [Lentisphaerae bacterium]|nr:DeoR/GlpR transcriptional regulator [Lentisphaerota bacterium]MBT4823093.1 DeoR/GlpR transcriptional regulator [Lentisphaerota bacterium]